jgi:hypothetical protein
MLSHPLQSETLQELAANETKEGKKTATEGMMWLFRYYPPPPYCTLDNWWILMTVDLTLLPRRCVAVLAIPLRN